MKINKILQINKWQLKIKIKIIIIIILYQLLKKNIVYMKWKSFNKKIIKKTINFLSNQFHFKLILIIFYQKVSINNIFQIKFIIKQIMDWLVNIIN